jgi:hypothetical protein
MLGGTFIIAVAILALGYVISWFLAGMVDDPPYSEAWFGDAPNVPEGLRAAARKAGGRAASDSGTRVRTDDIAHRGGGTTR